MTWSRRRRNMAERFAEKVGGAADAARASHEDTPDRADLRDRLDNDIRELRGAEPAEMARRLLDRGWRLATPDRADLE